MGTTDLESVYRREPESERVGSMGGKGSVEMLDTLRSSGGARLWSTDVAMGRAKVIPKIEVNCSMIPV